MVDIITETVSNINVNSQDLSPPKNNVLSRDIINFDPAIITMSRFDSYQELQYNCNRYRSSNEQYYDTSYVSNYHCQTHTDDQQQQQINVVDQMIAQPHIPYALLPKHFKPKKISNNRNQQQSNLLNNNHYYYNSYSYPLPQKRSHLSKNTIPLYEINRWQEPYTRSERDGFCHRRNNDNCTRDDHRINRSRNDKGAKAYEVNDNNY